MTNTRAQRRRGNGHDTTLAPIPPAVPATEPAAVPVEVANQRRGDLIAQRIALQSQQAYIAALKVALDNDSQRLAVQLAGVETKLQELGP